MASKVLNIEIGDRLTKVCLSIPKGKTYQIKNSFMFQTPDNAVADGVITAPDILATKLKEQLTANGIGDAKAAVFSLTSGKVATREVMLPPVKDNRIKGIVESNASEYFPIDMSRYHITYKLLERISKGEETGCRVLVLAAPLSLLETYFKLASLAGLSIHAIDFSGNSQYQALRTLRSEGVTMYVNVDCNNSFVTFIQDGKLILQRAFTFGGDELILSYMAAAGKSSDEYVSALHDCSQEEPQFLKDGVMSASDVTDNLSRLVSSIVRSTDYFNSNHWDVQVEKVVLMGPCSHLVGLIGMVGNGTGLETAYLDDIPGITSFANVAESASFYISCIGSSIEPVDFVPPQFKPEKKRLLGKREKSDEHSIRDGIIICAVCLAAAIGLSAVAILGYYDARETKAKVEEQIAELSYTRDTYNTYTEYQTGADALTQLAASIDSPNDGLTGFISELEEKMPSEILILSATCTRDSVSMNITVPSFDDVAVVLVQLRTFQSINNLNISSVSEAVDEAGVSSVSFSISCNYGTNPYIPAAGAEG